MTAWGTKPGQSDGGEAVLFDIVGAALDKAITVLDADAPADPAAKAALYERWYAAAGIVVALSNTCDFTPPYLNEAKILAHQRLTEMQADSEWVESWAHPQAITATLGTVDANTRGVNGIESLPPRTLVATAVPDFDAAVELLENRESADAETSAADYLRGVGRAADAFVRSSGPLLPHSVDNPAERHGVRDENRRIRRDGTTAAVEAARVRLEQEQAERQRQREEHERDEYDKGVRGAILHWAEHGDQTPGMSMVSSRAIGDGWRDGIALLREGGDPTTLFASESLRRAEYEQGVRAFITDRAERGGEPRPPVEWTYEQANSDGFRDAHSLARFGGNPESLLSAEPATQSD